MKSLCRSTQLVYLTQSCQVEHVKCLDQSQWLPSSSQGGATERSQFRKWRHLPDYQIHCLCKRNHDAIVVLAPSGANFRSLWSAFLRFTPKCSWIHTKSMLFCRKNIRSIIFSKLREILDLEVMLHFWKLTEIPWDLAGLLTVMLHLVTVCLVFRLHVIYMRGQLFCWVIYCHVF